MTDFAAIVFIIASWCIVGNAIPRITRWTQLVTFALSAVGAGTFAHFLVHLWM